MYSFKWLLLCEISNIEINFRSARIWAYLPSLHLGNWKRLLRTKRTQTKVQGRFRCNWRMVRRSSIHTIQAQNSIRFSIQSTTNLNTSVLMKPSGCSMHILFANHQMTMFQAASFQFQACPELNVWRTRFGPSGSLWEHGLGVMICQEHWWRMELVLERLSPQLQRQCFANCWLRKL